MRRNRKNSLKKERIIMLTSSAFVLAALTMTGIYIKNKNEESRNDGYTIDFTALENSAGEISQIADSLQKSDLTAKQPVTEDDLDYMPLEVDSGQVEIPGLTDSAAKSPIQDAKEKAGVINEKATPKEVTAQAPVVDTPTVESPQMQDITAEEPVVTAALNFSEANGLVRPVSGDILMHYSMDGSIYFKTLDQYKYNPAVIFSAAEGTQVNACAEGRVVAIYEDAQIGQAVTLDLGNGYQVTYGQLRDLGVTQNSYVKAGDVLGFVAAPTKYYSLEGSNLYFKLTKDNVAVNPEQLFQ